MIQHILINFQPNEYNQELHYYPFTINLDRWVGSLNTLDDLCNKVCIPNKTKDLNLSVFNIIIRKVLTNHVSCECKCKFDGWKFNSNQKWNNVKCRYECKKHMCEKDYNGNPATCSWKNGKYLATVINSSVITCDEIIEPEETKTFPKNIICEIKRFYISVAFLLITIALLTSFGVYLCLVKYKAKPKHFLPYYVTNDKLIIVF